MRIAGIETNLTISQIFSATLRIKYCLIQFTLVQKTRLETIGIIAAVVAAGAGVSQAWTAWQAYQGQQNPPTSISSISSPSPASAATPSSPAGIILVSEVGADYTQLQNLLKARKYKEADQETNRMMLYVARREKEGWLDTKDMENFPCQDLRTIDQLWVKNSNGRFGFSVQRQIYNQVGKDWLKWGDQVEWRVNGNWKGYDEMMIWDIRAPQAHLPSVFGDVVIIVGIRILGLQGFWISSLEPRLAKCSI